MSTLRIKRVYLPPERSDGFRVLIDRLWPRGVSKQNAKIDYWLKNVAPSHELRKWFNHDPQKWKEFKKRYHKELLKNPADILWLENKAAKKKVTLLFAATDEEHNNAVALKVLLKL